MRDREHIKDSFYHDWDKMQRILKAGYPKPVSLAMNNEIKVMIKILTHLLIFNCCSRSLKCIMATPRVTTSLPD